MITLEMFHEKISLAFWVSTPQNGQTHSISSPAFAGNLFECVSQFFVGLALKGLTWVLLLLFLIFISGFWLYLMYLIHLLLSKRISSSISLIHGFHLFCYFDWSKKITLLIRTNRIDLICLGQSSDKKVIVATVILNLTNSQGGLLLPRNLVQVTFGDLKILFSTKVNLLFLLFCWIKVKSCTLHLVRKNCAWKSHFLKSLLIYFQVVLYLPS